MQVTSMAINWSERGLIPDYAIRAGIRRLLEVRLNDISAGNCEIGAQLQNEFVQHMNVSPIAPVPELANAQHYEVPAEFFQHCLGRHRKYSSCYWAVDTKTLDEAERLALELTCQHATLQDGQRVLELGCGWGSLTLWMAQHYPASSITAVSNSNSQREYIMSKAASLGLNNIRVITCDMNHFQPSDFGIEVQSNQPDFESNQPSFDKPRFDKPGFDRIVSVEMFEHMRNYRELYHRVHDWLVPGGRFFKHIFVHRLTPYAFEVAGEDDWMSQFFFSGGIMPSDDLPLQFQQELKLLERWRWDGTHYEKTANAWLANMDANASEIWPILESTYGKEDAEMWRNRWRIFYMSCAELFGLKRGQEWWVTHYLFERPAV